MPKTVKHQSFKLTPHGHPKEKVLLYVVVAALVGVAIGWILKDHFISALGMMGY